MTLDKTQRQQLARNNKALLAMGEQLRFKYFEEWRKSNHEKDREKLHSKCRVLNDVLRELADIKQKESENN